MFKIEIKRLKGSVRKEEKRHEVLFAGKIQGIIGIKNV